MDKGKDYYRGAQIAAQAVRERLFAGGFRPKGEDWIYLDAEFNLITKTPQNIEIWLNGETVAFKNHKRKKGKLISCDAFFPELENKK